MEIGWIAFILIGLWLIAYVWVRSRSQHGTSMLTESSHSFEVPIWYDSEIGEYKCILEFRPESAKFENENSTSRFEVIPDTGSRLLLVSGPQCRSCSVSGGLWNRNLGIPTDPTLRTIEYVGGQSTTYQVHDGYLTEVDFPIRVGVATASNRQFRPENILGLSGEDTDDAFLKTWPRKRVVFVFDQRRLYLGSIPKHLLGIIAQSSKSFPMEFGIAPGIKIMGGSLHSDHSEISISSGRVLFDTGTTQSLAEIEMSGSSLDLNTGDSTLSIPLSEFPIVKAPFPLPHGVVLILGNRHLRNFNLDFDYDQKTLTLF